MPLPALPDSDVYLEVFDEAKLDDAYSRYVGTGSLSSTDFTFSLSGAQHHVSSVSAFRTIEATIPAATYLGAFQAFGDRLFRYNPRFHLGSNRVNKEMLETLKENPEQFYLFNNGITAVCDGFRVVGEELRVQDFQVVNGCQTTHVLDDARKRYGNDKLEKAFVNLRLIEGQNLQREVSARTNRQTALQYTDEVSGLPELLKLHDLFRRLATPWFFEHKRGAWQALSQREKARFARYDAPTKWRMVKAKPVAQAALAARGQPGRAKDRVREVFTNVGSNADFQDIFGRKPYELLLPSLLHEEAGVWSLTNRESALAAQDPWVGWFKFQVVFAAYGFLRQHYEKGPMLNETTSRKLVIDAEAWMPRLVPAVAHGLNSEIKRRVDRPAELRRFLRNDDRVDDILQSGLMGVELARDAGNVDFGALLP